MNTTARTRYRIDFPPFERAHLIAMLCHDRGERIHRYAFTLLNAAPPIFSEFEAGFLLALVSPLREEMPETWRLLNVAAEAHLAARP